MFALLSEILASRKKKYTELARSINITKIDIDTTRSRLDNLKDEREAAGKLVENICWLFSLKITVLYNMMSFVYV